MGRLIFWCVDTVMSIYSLALLIYVVMSWLHQYLPKRWQILDWSPVGAWLLLGIVRSMLKWVLL